MQQVHLQKYESYINGPFEIPAASNNAWLLTAKCPREGKSSRQYTHNLTLTPTYPTGYSYPDGKAIKPAEVLVRFDAVGACASDVKIAAQGSGHPRMRGRDLEQYPAVMGHEVALTVIGVGEALRGKYNPGDRYVVNAETILGGEKVTFGYKLPGGFRQFGVYGQMLLHNDDGSALVQIPRDMSYLVAASLEPFACCYNTLDLHRPELRSVQPGGKTWLMGAGPMSRAFVESMLSRQTNYPAKLAVTEISQNRMRKFEETVGKKAEAAGIKVDYIYAHDRETMFRKINGFFRGSIDDVFLMFVAPKKILSPLVRGALEKTTKQTGVFDVFAGLPEEVIIHYRGSSLPLKAIHYGGSETLNTGVKVIGFSGLQSKHLVEAKDAYLQKRIDPYGTMIAAVASLDQLPDVLHRIEAAEIDGKCIMLPHATSRLGFQTARTLSSALDGEYFAGLGINTQRLGRQLRRGKFTDEITQLLFEQFVA